jgi:hypothetical protein
VPLKKLILSITDPSVAMRLRRPRVAFSFTALCQSGYATARTVAQVGYDVGARLAAGDAL